MLRFFDLILKNHKEEGTRKLNLGDMALGDTALQVVARILKNNSKFSQVDLSKNCFSNTGLKQLGLILARHNDTIVHLDIGGNHIQTEGAMSLFKSLANHPSLVSLNLANNDCYKNKIKIGAKGAEELHRMLSEPLCLITNLDLTDNALTVDAMGHVLKGMQACRSLISINLTQNDLGLSNSTFTQLMQVLDYSSCQNEHSILQELNLSENQL